MTEAKQPPKKPREVPPTRKQMRRAALKATAASRGVPKEKEDINAIWMERRGRIG